MLWRSTQTRQSVQSGSRKCVQREGRIVCLLIYLLLFCYWAEKVFGLSLSNFPGLSYFNLIIYILLFIWLFSVVRERKFLRAHEVNKYLFIMVFVILLSIPNKILRGEISDINLLGEIINIKSFLNPIILFFILFNVVDDEKTCNRSILGLLLLLLVTVSSQILEMFGVIEYGATVEAYESARLSGLGDANDYASFLVLFIPILLSGFLFKKSALIKSTSAVLLFLSFLGLLATGSRGGALSFLFSMLVYCFFLHRERILSLFKIMFFIIVLFLVGGAALVIMPSTLKEELGERFDLTEIESADQLTAGRTLIWRKGLLLFMESPVIGHGHHVFRTLLGEKYYVKAACHNQYLYYAVNYGIIGLVLLLMVYLKLFQYVWNRYRETRDAWKKQIYISFFAGFCGYLFSLMSINMTRSGYIFLDICSNNKHIQSIRDE